LKRFKELFNPNTRKFWDRKYGKYIESHEVRSDGGHLQRFMELFSSRDTILDFGAGLGGNVQYLSRHLKNTHFILVDQSITSLDYARESILGERDESGNRFSYLTDLHEIPEQSVPLILSIEVLEHITDYRSILDTLWSKLQPGGILLISVPVKGIRDRNRQHVNKFTVNSMFRILVNYGKIVHISPRSYSNRTGKISTAYFYVIKADN
jgi:2-polyprenyl-3-methyl-5-hydroxy-6-metoxy-1,4-benzoquinol methylase